MLQKMEQNLYSMDIYQCIKKLFIIIFAIGMCTCLSGCSKQTLTDQQIDEIIIYTPHVSYEPSVVLVSITDEELIKELVLFFDEMECKEITTNDTLEAFDDEGWDAIEFRKNGKTLKQYTLNGMYICEEEPDTTYINIYSKGTGEDLEERIDVRTWSTMSKDDTNTWEKLHRWH